VALLPMEDCPVRIMPGGTELEGEFQQCGDKVRVPMARHSCTAADPWVAGKPGPTVHLDAYKIGQDDEGSYYCPNCGRTLGPQSGRVGNV
jgi:hypothetical protein